MTSAQSCVIREGTSAEEQTERLAVLTKIEIRNYRVFQRFSLAFRDGLNVVVGDNDSGKTTLLEAVSVALTGRLGDKQLQFALSPHLFNQASAAAYIAGLEKDERPAPPEITIDLFLDGGMNTPFSEERTTSSTRTRRGCACAHASTSASPRSTRP